MSPKEFMLEKKPSTDVERVACLAYYAAHYRDQPEINTRDISTLNQEAGLQRIGNPTQATDNALKGGYLIHSSRGHKQISALGEQIVQALPDRGQAKLLFKDAGTRRRPAKRRNAKARK